jgi:diguanylate cyclase (GGDEF)-like protein/PAS domain S-box-containing protein
MNFKLFFNTTKDGIAITDLETNFLFFNKAYMDITGFSKEELYKTSCKELSAPEDMQNVKNLLENIIEADHFGNIEKTCIVKNGKRIQVNISISVMPDKKRLLLSTKNITEQKDKEILLKNYISLIDKNIITSTTDINGKITDVSEAFCRISGYSKDELIGSDHNLIRHPDEKNETFINMWNELKKDKVWKGEIKNIKKNKEHYWIYATISPIFDKNGEKIGYTSIRQDITDKKTIEEISITDALTNIYNRRYFNEMFPKVINSAKRKNELVCFLIMDIDFFKQYNDTYGHQMGDRVLTSVAKKIKDSLKRASDHCFRLGGEEFGIVFNVDKKEQSIMFANTIKRNIEGLKIEHSKNKASKYITASMGLICKSANDIEDEDQIYKEADELLYKAKESGRNKVISN